MAPAGDGWTEPDALSWNGRDAAWFLRMRAPVNEREPAKEREDWAREWASERGRASGKGWERASEPEQEWGLERWSERWWSEPEEASREP
jgi:hypothetical protein